MYLVTVTIATSFAMVVGAGLYHLDPYWGLVGLAIIGLFTIAFIDAWTYRGQWDSEPGTLRFKIFLRILRLAVFLCWGEFMVIAILILFG